MTFYQYHVLCQGQRIKKDWAAAEIARGRPHPSPAQLEAFVSLCRGVVRLLDREPPVKLSGRFRGLRERIARRYE